MISKKSDKQNEKTQISIKIDLIIEKNAQLSPIWYCINIRRNKENPYKKMATINIKPNGIVDNPLALSQDASIALFIPCRGIYYRHSTQLLPCICYIYE